MRYVLALLVICLLSVPALAAFQGPGVAPTVTTAAQALAAADDTPCVLEGHIVEKLKGKDKYTFKDASGSIVVEIDDKIFGKRTVTPATKVRLTGEVDKDANEPGTIEVDRLDIL